MERPGRHRLTGTPSSPEAMPPPGSHRVTSPPGSRQPAPTVEARRLTARPRSRPTETQRARAGRPAGERPGGSASLRLTMMVSVLGHRIPGGPNHRTRYASPDTGGLRDGAEGTACADPSRRNHVRQAVAQRGLQARVPQRSRMPRSRTWTSTYRWIDRVSVKTNTAVKNAPANPSIELSSWGTKSDVTGLEARINVMNDWALSNR